MQGLMQETPLTLQMVLERARTIYPRKHVGTLTAEGVRRSTYGDLAERVDRLASALAAAGVEPGDRVATFMWNSQAHLELYLAVPCMGAVLHTLNIRLAAQQVHWIAEHAEDTIVVVDASLAQAWAQVPALPKVRQVICYDDLSPEGTTESPAVEGALDYERFLADASPSFAWPELDEGSAAAMCYTSGTTGDPKGVVYSHRSSLLHAAATLFADGMAVSEREVLLPIVPQFHANAWGTPYGALLGGADLAMPARFMDPVSIADLVEEEQITLSAAVPTIWFGVLQAIEAGTIAKEKLASLDRIVVGGSAVPEGLMRGFDKLGIRIIHAWGMTETSPLGSVATVKSTVPESDVLRTRLTQGLPAAMLDVRIVDDEGQVQPWDGKSVGELQIAGPWIADAYYEPSAADGRGGEEKFDADDAGRRWLRTGDVANIDGEGYITLVDRMKDLVKSGGEWISTVDLENLLVSNDKVSEAAVIAIPDAKWDERPLAYVVKADEGVTEDELRDYLGEHVAKWQVPDAVRFVDEIPKTSVGKLNKKVLRAEYAEEG